MAPEITHYGWSADGRAGREAVLRWGVGGDTVLLVPPLFEEANRTRATLTAVARDLAGRGIVAALPDLPAQNDSPLATRDARLTSWRRALAGAAATLTGRIHVAAVRAGALLDRDVEAASRWYWSPMSGAEQVRELERLRVAGDGESHGGNLLAGELLGDLAAAEPLWLPPCRIVRLATDPRPADATLAFAPPWRASEPVSDSSLAAALADDIAGWIAR